MTVSGASRRMRRVAQSLMLVALAVGALAVPAAAQAKTLTVTDADVGMRLAHDATLLVNDGLTINSDSRVNASYRDIDVKPGEKITDVQVSEPGGLGKYRTGGCTKTGCIDKPGTFGTVSKPGGVRVVWHQGDVATTRTFDLSYRVTNVVVAYNDILDIRWQPWGSQWDQPLPHLTASFSNPRLRPGDPAYRVWGYPRQVQGTVVRGRGAATLTSSPIPAHQYVAMQVTMPRNPHEDVSGAMVVHSD